ncbi:MAG TPA: tripartite tricarboxylate transporter TctB family protein [Bacillota bacterium]|nr:tripartite tricarboxylate transporter TctB family protein [Bacillota bacterium]
MKKVRANANLIFSACIFLISLIYLFDGKDLVLGTMKRPGVGFLPIVSGVLLAVLSLFEIVKALLSKKDAEINIDWKKIATFFAGVIADMLLLKPLGYIITTFALLVFLTKLFGAKSWVKPLIFSAVMSLGSYYLFIVALQVQLP